VLPIIISTIIIALIIYTLTLDKIRDIALLKLIGVRNGVICGLILQQALLMGAFGYALAWWIGQYAFPHFPRLVRIDPTDLVSLALIVVVIAARARPLGRQVMELFAKIAHERQAGVIVVTHDHRPLDVFDRILDVEDGRIQIRAGSLASSS